MEFYEILIKNFGKKIIMNYMLLMQSQIIHLIFNSLKNLIVFKT